MPLHKTTYQTEDGELITAEYAAPVPVVNYPARREQFCRDMSTGEDEPVIVYCRIWGKDLAKATDAQKTLWGQAANRLMNDPQIKLRIDQLKTPVVRKYTKKFEYTLQRAFEQCDEAYNLARIENDPKAMLKAIELQGKFAKLLAEQLDVNHRIGLLDDASTEALLGMLSMIEKKRQGLQKITGPTVEGSVIEKAEGGIAPAAEGVMGPI